MSNDDILDKLDQVERKFQSFLDRSANQQVKVEQLTKANADLSDQCRNLEDKIAKVGGRIENLLARVKSGLEVVVKSEDEDEDRFDDSISQSFSDKISDDI